MIQFWENLQFIIVVFKAMKGHFPSMEFYSILIDSFHQLLAVVFHRFSFHQLSFLIIIFTQFAVLQSWCIPPPQLSLLLDSLLSPMNPQLFPSPLLLAPPPTQSLMSITLGGGGGVVTFAFTVATPIYAWHTLAKPDSKCRFAPAKKVPNAYSLMGQGPLSVKIKVILFSLKIIFISWRGWANERD